MTIREHVRLVTQVDLKGWRPHTALLRTLGVAVPLLLGFFLGKPSWGVLASIGALYTGTASFGGIHPIRVQRMLAASFATAALTGVACLINRGDVVAVTGVILCAFLMAIVGTLNAGANVVAIQATAALVIVSGIPASRADPGGNALLVLAGGLLQTAFLSLFGPFSPFFVERTAVAELFSGLGSFVRDLQGDHPAEIPDSDPFLTAIARLEEAEASGLRPEHLPLKHAVRVAETVRAALVGYARAFRSLRVKSHCPDCLADVNERLAKELDSIGGRIQNGVFQGVYEQEQSGVSPNALEGELLYWWELIQRDLADIGEPQGIIELRKGRWWWLPRLGSLTALFDSKALQGITLVHSARYALAVGLSDLVSRMSHTEHSYWFPLTVALILRSDYATTLSKGAARAAGTLVGVAIASGVDRWLHPSTSVLIALVIVSTWFGFSVYQANYMGFTFAVTLFVVFSVSATGISEPEVGEVRMMATLLGVLVSLAISLLWPLWQSREVRGLLREAFLAQAAYGREVSRLLEGEPAPDAEELRRKARSLRIDAQKLAAAAAIEPKWGRQDHLESSSDQLGMLAAGGAEMLFVHAQALIRHEKSLTSRSALRDTLLAAIARADAASVAA